MLSPPFKCFLFSRTTAIKSPSFARLSSRLRIPSRTDATAIGNRFGPKSTNGVTPPQHIPPPELHSSTASLDSASGIPHPPWCLCLPFMPRLRKPITSIARKRAATAKQQAATAQHTSNHLTTCILTWLAWSALKTRVYPTLARYFRIPTISACVCGDIWGWYKKC